MTTVIVYEIFYDDGKGNTHVVEWRSEETGTARVIEEFERARPGSKVLEVR